MKEHKWPPDEHIKRFIYNVYRITYTTDKQRLRLQDKNENKSDLEVGGRSPSRLYV